MPYPVQIDQETYLVDVNQTGKTVWVASAQFQGKNIEGRGGSRQAALGQWRKYAIKSDD